MFSGKSILVVDDEPDLREILADEMTLAGAEVEMAGNGKLALQEVEKKNFDVVVSDLRMPGGDGATMAKAIKARNVHKPLVVLMTGFADLTAEEAYDLGVEGFLTKPFHLEIVRETLERILQEPAQRWAAPQTLPVEAKLSLPQDPYGQTNIESYLGRGGIFFPGERLSVRIGQVVQFEIGPVLKGEAFVRWVRLGVSEGRGPGVGLEFLRLEPAALDWVLSKNQNIRSYLPRGF